MKRIHLLPTSFQNRLIIGVGLLLIIIIAVATVSLLSIQSISEALRGVVYVSNIEIGYVMQLRVLLFEASTLVDHYYTYNAPGGPEAFAQLSSKIEKVFDNIRTTSVVAEYKDSITYAQQEWQLVRDVAEAILRDPAPKTSPITIERMGQFDIYLSVLFTSVSRLNELIIQKANVQQLESQKVSESTLVFIYIIFGLGMTAAIIIIFLLLRSVLIPIRLLKQGADSFSKGNLAHRVPVVSRDEFGELAKEFNVMAETLEKDQAALEELAVHDGLTGLYNHREFQRRLQIEIERAKRYKHNLSLLMIDIDHFKNFNDAWGHQAGDRVLYALGTNMRREIRAVDYAARYGGEEFTIVLPEMAASAAIAAAERFRKSIAGNNITIGKGQTVNITVSIGVATFPEDAKTKDKLIAAADKALYAAKAAGRNKVLRTV